MTIAFPSADRAALVERLAQRALRGGAADNDDALAVADPPPEPYDFAKDFWLARPYFAKDYAGEVMERFAAHVQTWETSGYGAAVFAAYRSYHNLNSDGDDDPITQLQAAGEVGELLALTLPHYRSLVRHQIALFTSERPAWDPQARTTDATASRQVPMAANLLDYVLATGNLDSRLAEQVELMMVAGAGFFVSGWDAQKGLDGRGWFTQRVCAPWEMAHEKVRTYDDCSWWIYRAYESRWDWVARYAKLDPEKAERIAQVDQSESDFGKHGLGRYDDESPGGDRIAVLYVIARPSAACPDGRMSIVAGEDLVLFDGPYPYGEDVVVSRMCASEFLGTSIPYADSWGVLAPADAYNAMLSMLVTRVDTCGVPNFCVPEGSEIEFSDIAGGNNIWKVAPGGQPTVVDLLQIPGAIPALLQLLSGEMEKATGINSVTRGQPAENVSSGSMAALLQSMAQQFNSNLERAWALNLERIGTHHVRIFQKMADEKHAISVVGIDEKWTVQEFQGEDLAGILRVSVKTASALSKTTAGRAEIADKLLERKLVNAQEYLRVIQTGQLQPIFHTPVGQLNGIKARCEKLMRGEPSPPLTWDNHQLCVQEFRALLDTEARYDPAISAAVNQALNEQLQLWSKLSRESPDILVAIGCPPLPQALQVGQQAEALRAMGQQPGAPPGAPPNMPPPPRQQEQPGTEEPKGKPGPAPQPPGNQPSRAAPAMPKEPAPAKTPDGRSVV